MPVVESYPSIVGIAQVAQSAGQGRYNQWLAEYNARSNQMKSNALMSGFQVGSNLGMSTARMWQQQQQFAQRQGQFESQAAAKLQKDTEFTQAMIPALDPLVKTMYPHLNEQQRGEYIGSLDRRQVDALTNNLRNAGNARAAWNLFGSPQALQKQAKAVYDKMVTGQKHHSARVQSRLEPLFQRMRDNDLGLNENAVQSEIAQILREEGEAKEGQSYQERIDQYSADIYDNRGNLVSKVLQVPDGKGGQRTMEIKIPQDKETAGRKTEYDIWDVDKANGIVDARHTKNVEDWQRTYGGYEGQDPDPDQVATYVAPTDGTMWRRARPGERHFAHRDINGQVTPVIPATIPPRPTKNMARNQAIQDNPELRQLLIPGARPSEVGTAIPTPGARVFAGGQAAAGGPVTRLRFPHEMDQPQAAPGAQPGQVMPQPQPRGMPVGVQPTPRQPAPRPPEAIQRNEEAVATAIQKLRGPEPGPLRPKDPSKPGGEWISEPRTLKHDLGKATHEGLTEMITAKRGEVLLAPSGPIGPQGDKREMMTFTDHMNAGRGPELFAPFIMRKPEAKSLETNIKNYAQKSRAFIGRTDVLGRLPESILKSGIPGEHGEAVAKEDLAAQVAHFLTLDAPSTKVQFKGDVGGYSTAKRAGFTEAEIRRFQDIHTEYDRARIKATSIAAAAHKATPPGELPELSNIPMLNNEDFEQRVLGVPVFNPKTQRHEPQPVQPGDVFLTPNDGFFMVSQKTIDTARRRGQIRYGSQLQQPNPYGIPGFMQNQQPTMVPSPWMQRTPNPAQ